MLLLAKNIGSKAVLLHFWLAGMFLLKNWLSMFWTSHDMLVILIPCFERYHVLTVSRHCLVRSRLDLCGKRKLLFQVFSKTEFWQFIKISA